MYPRPYDYSYNWYDDRNSSGNLDEYDYFHSTSPPWDSYYKHNRDGHSSTERACTSRYYSDSPERLCRLDSAGGDRSRNSPARRGLSPPVRDVPEVKRQRLREDVDVDYRFKQNAPENIHRLSPESFSANQQLRYSPSHEGDVRYTKMSPCSRSRHQLEELPLKKQDEDFRDRGLSDHFEATAYQQRSHGYSLKRTPSPHYATQIQANWRETIPSPSKSGYYDEYYESRTTAPLNGSSGQSFKSEAPQRSTAPPEDKPSQGFQRFLEVLNQGVNVDVLTQLVSQNPTPPCDGRVFPKSLVNKHCKDTTHWDEQKESIRSESPQPYRTSGSPNRNPESVGDRLFEEKCSPVEKSTEDEQKHQQIQDVLRAIGVDLGSEELGQMSHRIQERLYGKKDNEGGRRLSRERSVGRTLNAESRSRLSSSRSSSIPPSQGFYTKQDSFSNPRDKADQQWSKYTPELNKERFQEDQSSERSKLNTVTSIRPENIIPPNPMPAVNQPPPAPMLPRPPYLPISHPPPPLPPITHPPPSFPPITLPPPPFPSIRHLPPPSYPTIPPPPLPFFPSAQPGVFPPPVPPMQPPQLPSPQNIVSPVLAQMMPPLPSQQPFNPVNVNTQQAWNTWRKPKRQDRPRFLQVLK